MATYAPPVGPKCRHLLPGSDFYSAVTGKADPNRAGPHAGLDFQPAVRGESDPIYWLVGGTITRIVRTMVQGSTTHTGYAYHTGNYVEWKGDDGYIWHYRHMPQWAMKDLKVGQRVKAGALATRMGTTGKSNGVHLHLGCRDKQGRFVDPAPILRNNGAWPINNTYHVKEDTLSAEEVKQINAHTTAQIDSIKKHITDEANRVLASVGSKVWVYKGADEPVDAYGYLRNTRRELAVARGQGEGVLNAVKQIGTGEPVDVEAIEAATARGVAAALDSIKADVTLNVASGRDD